MVTALTGVAKAASTTSASCGAIQKESGQCPLFVYFGSEVVESIFKTDTENKVISMVEAAIRPLGFEVADLDCRVGGRSLLRIFVSRVQSGQTSIEDCAEVSRVVGTLLEAQDIFPGPYELEVSSPGLDRRLRQTKDFLAEIGSELKLQLRDSLPGIGANIKGKLVEVANGLVKVEASGKLVEVPLQQVLRANKVWELKVTQS